MGRLFAIFAVVVVAVTAGYPGQAEAQGFIGGLIERGCGNCGVGKQLDRTNRDIKRDFKPYGQAEEAISGAGRKIGSELGGETAGPALAGWIQASRSNVINSGVRPIPEHIIQQLQGFFSPQLLRSVRYRSGWGNEVALPALSFRFGDAAAIALIDVVMFRNERDAQNNPKLWAHELTHIQQYQRWGVLDFAKRYVKDHGGVEAEADANAERFASWYSRRQISSYGDGSDGNYSSTTPNRPGPYQSAGGYAPPVIMPQMSMVCRNQFGWCAMMQPNPVGAQCACMTYGGPVYGMVAP